MLKVSDRSVLYDESRVTYDQQIQQRFNHLMVLHVHSDHTDKLNLVDVANEFIEHRRQVFGNGFNYKSVLY